MLLGVRVLLLIRREVPDKVGIFDPRSVMYFEDEPLPAVKVYGMKGDENPLASVVHLAG